MNQPPLANPGIWRRYPRIVVHALVVCSAPFVPSRRGRGHDVHFLLDMSPVSTKTARRDDTDGQLSPNS